MERGFAVGFGIGILMGISFGIGFLYMVVTTPI